MHEKIITYKNAALEKWNNIEKPLRIKIILITVFLLIALFLTIYLTTRPNWIVLESNSDIQTIGKMQNAFDSAGIKNKITQNGTSIQVQDKDINKAKLLLAENNITQSGFSFEDALNANTIGSSETDKKEIYLRAYQTEIAEQIKNIEGIEDADVKLVLPSDSLIFNDNKKEASAGVVVTTSTELTSAQTLTIARLVSMSVEGLSMDNIEIIDQNAKSLYSGSSTQDVYSNKEDIENKKTKEIEMQIRAALAQLYDDVNIIPNVKFDWSNKSQRDVYYTTPIEDSTVGVPKSQVVESESVVNGSSGAEPGVGANDQTVNNYSISESSESSTYDATKESSEYLYNQSEIITDTQGGTIQLDESSISIVVYNYKEFKEEDLINNKTLTSSYTWEDFKADNSAETRLEIDPDLIETLRVGTGISNLTMVGYEKPMFIDYVKEPIQTEQIILLIVLIALLALLAFGLIKKAQPDDVEEIEPEISIEDLIVSNKREDEKVAEELEKIEIDENSHIFKIECFIEESPEDVARILRNWLSDRS